jgi:hypothetical protein
MVVLPRAHHNAHSASADDFYALLVLPLIRRLESGAWDLVVSVEPD